MEMGTNGRNDSGGHCVAMYKADIVIMMGF